MSERTTRELIAAWAADRGLTLTEEQLDAAAEMHVHFRPELDRLRGVSLEYLPPFVEPATAVEWIERGGRSA
jgi:hypothetical protein